MPDPPPAPRVVCEPAIERWAELIQPQRARPCDGSTDHPIAENASRLQTGPADGVAPAIATGHQAMLWHPGILAKDLAAANAAQRLGLTRFHLVVDHDEYDPLNLELPVVRGGRLSVETLRLGAALPAVPPGCQPAVDPASILAVLRDARGRLGDALAADPARIERAFTDPPPCRTLAEQMTVALERLRRPHVGPTPVLFSRQLARLTRFGEVVTRMLDDARRCADAYNRAIAAAPGAGVAPLRVETDRVELPLWWLQWKQPRQRVFADLSSPRPTLKTAAGRAIDPQADAGTPDPHQPALAPKALLLTAAVRDGLCALFVHGRGGGAYDRATELWWRDWLARDLAPLAVVTADARLPFSAPMADRDQLNHARWRAHHLPHNIDREVPAETLDAHQVARKRQLLAEMSADRDRRRRAERFAELHRINADLARAHPRLVEEAQADVERATLGLANRAVAIKRDWCFALYPDDQLTVLSDALTGAHTVTSDAH